MEKTSLSSPVLSNILSQSDEALHSGFQQLIQHNAAPASTTYNHTEQLVDIDNQVRSNTNSRYSSPTPQTNTMSGYDHHTPIPPYAAPSYTGGYQAAYPVDPSPYPQLPDVGSSTTSHNAYSTPATSPPTPVQIEGITTRSGRAIIRPSAAPATPRPSRTPARSRAKKRKRASGDDGADQPMSLRGPLSELVKDMTGITDTDIEAYVNRPPDERRKEVAQSKTGKVKRPMNAFMLYRKAYQNRTKEWKRLDDIRRKEESANEGKPEKGHDNHQVISQVCGLSWNIEPQELRDQYDEWAKIERNNHKLAFPDYKFAPAKSKAKKQATGSGVTGGSSGSRHDDRESDEENASNLDAYDFQEWGRSGSGPPSRNATRPGRYMDPDADYVLQHGYSPSVYTSPSPGMQAARLPATYGGHMHHGPPHQSAFQYANPGKPRPADYRATLSPRSQYYHQQNAEFVHQQQQQQQQQAYQQRYGGGVTAAYGVHHHHAAVPTYVDNVLMSSKRSSPGSSFHGSPILDHHHQHHQHHQQAYNDMIVPSASYGPQILHPHIAIPHSHLQSQHQARHPQEQQQQQQQHHHHHSIDPSLMPTHHHHQESRGAGAHDPTYDTLGLLGVGQGGDFSTDGLPVYQLEHGAGGFAGSHLGSPHPQQFEQAYHTPAPEGSNSETAAPTTTTAAAPAAAAAAAAATTTVESSWQDDIGVADGKVVGPSDWETVLGSAAEFQLEDIDQILGTTTDSPGG